MDLVLAPGRIYGLLGLNGAGKSTLLRLLTGLLFPKSGRVRALGEVPARRTPGFLSRLFVLSEELDIPRLTDREYIAVKAPFYPGFDHDRMTRYLDELEIPKGRRLTTLSHGQRKKFLLSFGLASNASLLALDEPTNGLDIPSKGLFRRLVAEALTDDRTLRDRHPPGSGRGVARRSARDPPRREGAPQPEHRGVERPPRTTFETSRPQEGAGELLYVERTVGGFGAVRKDAGAGDRRLDLELLFKAVIASPDACSEIFHTVNPA